MRRVLLTGISGTGKSTLINELAARGYKAVDTDHGGFSELRELPVGSDPSGIEGRKDWLWNEDRMAQLLDTDDADILFVSGASANQSKFYGRFDHVVLLSAPVAVLRERLLSRTNNPYGKRPDQLTRALGLKETVEPLLRRAATIEVDTTAPLGEVVDRIIAVVSR